MTDYRAVHRRAAQLMAESDLLNARAELSRLRLAARAVANTRPHPTDPVLLRRVEALRRELGDRATEHHFADRLDFIDMFDEDDADDSELVVDDGLGI